MGLAFKILKRSCKIGDRVIITSSTGTSEGIILDMDDGEVALELDNGGFLTTRGDDIIAMKTVNVTPIDNSINHIDKEKDTSIPIDNSDLDINPKSTVVESLPSSAPAIEEKSEEESKTNDISEAKQVEVFNSIEEFVENNQNQSDPPKVKSVSPDELLAMQWRDSRWKSQTYRKMLTAIEKIGDYHNEEELKKKLPIKGQFSSSTNGIIIDSFSGTKYFYNTDELLLP